MRATEVIKGKPAATALFQSIRRRGYLSAREVSERGLRNQNLPFASNFGYLTRLYQGLIIAAKVAVTCC